MKLAHPGGDAGAAGGNLRSCLIQSYARDMGNGKTIMMREIDVPIPGAEPALGRVPHGVQAVTRSSATYNPGH
jgi:hypothetical protein